MVDKKLTSDRVAYLTALMKPQEGDVVVLIFVKQQNSEYLMCAPVACNWLEAIAAIAAERGILPKPQKE